jgi:hypothetical protein
MFKCFDFRALGRDKAEHTWADFMSCAGVIRPTTYGYDGFRSRIFAPCPPAPRQISIAALSSEVGGVSWVGDGEQ